MKLGKRTLVPMGKLIFFINMIGHNQITKKQKQKTKTNPTSPLDLQT